MASSGAMVAISKTKSFKSTLLVLCLLASLLYPIKAHGGADDSDGKDQSVDLHSKGLILVKIYCLIILLVSTFAGGISPYFYRWNETFLLLGTQFAGGVFLGTALMHFLSDSAETFGDLTTKTYPFSFMLASAGYLLTMLGDCIVAFVVVNREKEAKVVEMEGGRTPNDQQEQATELALDTTNPAFIKTSSVGDTILLIIALCFHSVFEGIAVGVSGSLQPCSLSKCFVKLVCMYIYVCLHVHVYMDRIRLL